MARERVPGACYFVTRRTHEGVYRLRPDPEVTNAIGYVVALACLFYGVEIVSFCAMSNHYHATVHDRFGRLADWETFVNGQLARYLNTIHERDSHVWSASEGNAIEIATPGHKFIEKTAYTLANPTKAGLVYAPTAWPGLYIGVEALRRGQRFVFTRPKDYFDATGRLPDEVDLVPCTPPGWKHEEFCDKVEAELERQLTASREALKAAGRAYLTGAGVTATSPFDRPAHTLPVNAGRAATPRVRLLGNTAGETRAMIARYKSFLERYGEALAAWREGLRDAFFPEGTWRLWRSFGARRDGPDSPATRWARGARAAAALPLLPAPS